MELGDGGDFTLSTFEEEFLDYIEELGGGEL